MRYIKENCSLCNEIFDEHSDVVVCPECGTPVHRHCWQAAGACPNAVCHGDAEFVWKPTQVAAQPEPNDEHPAEQPTNLCDHCGEYSEPGVPFCINCGAEQGRSSPMELFKEMSLEREKAFLRDFPAHWVNGKELRAGDTVAGQPIEEICLQLRSTQRVTERYLSRFARQRKLSWNWAAFLMGPYWMFFRKLFTPAVIFGAVALAITFMWQPIFSALFALANNYPDASLGMLWQVIREHSWLSIVVGSLFLLGRVASGLLGDYLLRGKIVGNIEKIKREDAVLGLDDATRSSTGEGAMRRLNRHQLLARMGGVSFFAPMLYFWAWWFLPGILLNFIGMFAR